MTEYAQTYPQKMWISQEMNNTRLNCYKPYGIRGVKRTQENLIDEMELCCRKISTEKKF